MLSPIDEIKSRLNIIDVIGGYIKLQKAGINFRALCPFHSEKKPSFFVSPSRQIWHCFGGCGEGGDIFKFVMRVEGVEFGDALRILAQKAGIELKRQDPKLKTERQRLYEVCELATQFFEKQLEGSGVGKEAKKYLLSRGISEKSIQEWRIGYAPDVWQGLSDFLTSRGYQKEEVEKSGLGLTTERGSFYDRFRGRIIFPIFDLNSQVVGFGGRIFKDKDKEEVAKYVNTPNTLLYDKSRILYGLDRARMDVRKKQVCVLVEGYTDVIMAVQNGFSNVVATSGTALTSYQLQILKRYSENLLTAFDMDIAGDSATKRGIDLAQKQGFNIKVIVMPEGSDPAEILNSDPKSWEDLMEKSKSILEFYFDTAFLKIDSAKPENKKEISKILLPVIKRIPNKIEQSFWIQQLANRLGVKESDVSEELKKVKQEEELYGLEPEEILRSPVKSRPELLEEKLLVLLLKSPQNMNLVLGEESFSPRAKIILTVLKDEQKPNIGVEEDYFNYLFLKSEIEEIEEKDIVPEIQLCLKEIQFLKTKEKLDTISQRLKEAEFNGDVQAVNELTQEFHQYSKELYNLETV
ncbi:MAG: DNA primase [Patescibacteria group bacterium]